MQDLSLHILDIVENAVRAEAKNIKIEVFQEENKHQLTVRIKDDGKGMDENMLKKVLDPFFTTKYKKRVGLGLSLFAQAVQQTEGELKIDSQAAKGTQITAVFNLSHPDMKPMGNILESLASMITAYPAIRFIYDYRNAEDTYHFDSYETQ